MSDRGRSTSRERGRATAGNDTNSNDTQSLRCRIFIGNLATEKTSKSEVEELFAKFGEIASCSLHNNFGFVQYRDGKYADVAVTEMHGKTLFGKRIDVNLAGLRRKPQSKDQFEGAPRKEEVLPVDVLKGAGRPPRERDRSPIRGDRELPYSRPADSYSNQTHHGPPQGNRSMDYYGEHRGEAYGGYDRREAPPPHARDYGDNAYRRPVEEPRPASRPYRPAIDCEIVSLSMDETHYAEEVESRFRGIGLVCNIGYPPSELPILELIDRIARTGTLYAAVLTSQNAQHRSCTLYVLHGTRQEHRNMPLDYALSFVARNFDSYLRAMRDPYYVPPTSTYLPPRNTTHPTTPAPASAPQNTITTLPSNEKEMSTDQIEAMIAKLKREKEEREAAAAKQKLPPTQPSAGEPERREEVKPVASSSYPYNSYAPPLGQNNGTTITVPSDGYYQQARAYEQEALYR